MSTKAALLRPLQPPAYERVMTDACPPADLHQRLSADVAGHRLELLFDGGDRLIRIIDLINGAAHSVDLIMYIFECDAAGRRILDALLLTANRGVRVPAALDSLDRKSDGKGEGVSVGVVVGRRRRNKKKKKK